MGFPLSALDRPPPDPGILIFWLRTIFPLVVACSTVVTVCAELLLFLALLTLDHPLVLELILIVVSVFSAFSSCDVLFQGIQSFVVTIHPIS